jgi:hypothetical protein
MSGVANGELCAELNQANSEPGFHCATEHVQRLGHAAALLFDKRLALFR